MWLVRFSCIKKAVFTNSVTDLCLTKLDVFDTFEEIQVCIKYDNEIQFTKPFQDGMIKQKE